MRSRQGENTACGNTPDHGIAGNGCLAAEIGKTIEYLRRQEFHLSQRDLAKRARVSRHALQLIEQGRAHKSSVGVLETILSSLHMNLQALGERAFSLSQGSFEEGSLKGDFTLSYPGEGFRIVSVTPKRESFFFGILSVEPKRTLAGSRLPHSESVLYQGFRGKLLFRYNHSDYLLSEEKYLLFKGPAHPAEVYNPDQIREASCFLITIPAFLSK